MHVIGEDISERLDVVPAQYRVIRTRRPKYACRACESAVVQAPAPEHLVKGGLPTEAMVAQVLVSKYAWHLPLYRQAQMLASQGIEIDRATLALWVGYAAAELAPLAERLRQILLASPKITVDETPAPVLDPGRGRTKTGYFWAIARDDRPWGGPEPPGIVYTYRPGRSAALGLKPLAGYCGIVQCDGYAVYKQMADPRREGGAATLAFCWAHLRRRFTTSPKAARHRSPSKHSRASARSMRSKQRSAVKAPRRGGPPARPKPCRWSPRSRAGSKRSSPASPPNRSSPPPSATASTTETASPAISTTDASRSIPAPSSAACDRLLLIAKTRSSPATTRALPTGPASPR